jgi:hypothetical protein
MIKRMAPLPEEIINRSFRIFYSRLPFRDALYVADLKINNFLSADEIRPTEGWLKTARKSMLLSLGGAAKNAGISPTKWKDFEDRESKGTIQINSLTKLAEALDCELVYAVRPKARLRFSQMLWNVVFGAISNHPLIHNSSPKNAHKIIASLALRRLNDPQFRRKQNWSKRV